MNLLHFLFKPSILIINIHVFWQWVSEFSHELLTWFEISFRAAMLNYPWFLYLERRRKKDLLICIAPEQRQVTQMLQMFWALAPISYKQTGNKELFVLWVKASGRQTVGGECFGRTSLKLSRFCEKCFTEIWHFLFLETGEEFWWSCILSLL